MDKKSELFDLRREKQELDVFLSTIVDTESPPVAQQTPPSGKPEEFLHFEPEFEPEIPAEKEIIPPPSLAISPESKESQRETTFKKDAIISPESHDFFAKSSDQGLPKIPVPSFTKKETTVSQSKQFDAKLDFPKPPEDEKSGEEPLGKGIVIPEKKAARDARYDFSPKQKSGVRVGLTVLVIFLVLLFVIAGYLWIYPDRGQKTLDWIRSAVPSVGQYFGATGGGSQSAVEEVKIRDVRQRLVLNKSLKKSVRVIEGMAENASANTISRISIAAQLYDDQGKSLSTMTVLAGNLLTDEQIESFDSGRLVSALQNQAKAKRNVLPNEKVPFMVVFPQEPAGIFKMSVDAVGFEKK